MRSFIDHLWSSCYTSFHTAAQLHTASFRFLPSLCHIRSFRYL